MLIPAEAFVLPSAARGPLQQRIRQMVTEGVLAGRFAAGHKMPSSRGLAAHLAVSRITVTLAYAELVSADYLTAKGRSGYFISDTAPVASEAPKLVARVEAVEFARLLGAGFAGAGGVERPAEALKKCQKALDRQPNRLASVQGAMKASQKLGDRDLTESYRVALSGRGQ